jgi:hypothetical protein
VRPTKIALDGSKGTATAASICGCQGRQELWRPDPAIEMAGFESELTSESGVRMAGFDRSLTPEPPITVSVPHSRLTDSAARLSFFVMRGVLVTFPALQFMLSKNPKCLEGGIKSPEPMPFGAVSPHSRLTRLAAWLSFCLGAFCYV